jgi:Na+-transporting methylmalonyl-CoA/oxaloacetate decarboxylase gamma subunit
MLAAIDTFLAGLSEVQVIGMVIAFLLLLDLGLLAYAMSQFQRSKLITD